MRRRLLFEEFSAFYFIFLYRLGKTVTHATLLKSLDPFYEGCFLWQPIYLVKLLLNKVERNKSEANQ